MATHRLMTALAAIVLSSPAIAAAQEALPKQLKFGDTVFTTVLGTHPDYYEGAQELRIPKEYRLDTNNPQELVDGELHRWFKRRDSYCKSLSGKYALPWKGMAEYVGYIDLDKRKFVEWGKAFPRANDVQYRCQGMVRDESEMRDSYFLFVTSQTSTAPRKYLRATIPFERPADITVEEVKHGVIRTYPHEGDKVPVIFNPGGGGDTTWGILSADSGEMIVQGTPRPTYGTPDHVAVSPDQRHVYVQYTAGLVVFDLVTGVPIKLLKGVGEQRTLATAFDPSGSVAVTVQPSRSRVTLIDTKNLEILANYQTRRPVLGVKFAPDDGKLFCW